MRCTQSLLLACAALCALAGSMPASAHGSVSVNGLLDLGVYRGFDGVEQVGTVQRSNLAISGSEELGGGARAVFRLSTRFELDTGMGKDAGLKPFWHDEATLGLRGAWGTLRVGRAMTAMWANDYKFDPWANYNRIASPAWQHWHPFTPSDPYANDGTAEYGRLDNGVFYDSPAVAGFTLRLSGSPERRPEPGAAGRPYSAVLEYARQAVLLMAAFDHSRTAGNGGVSRTATLSGTYRLGRTTLKAGYSRQRLNTETNRFASFGADYAFSRRTVLYASLGHRRDARRDARTAFGVGMSHGF